MDEGAVKLALSVMHELWPGRQVKVAIEANGFETGDVVMWMAIVATDKGNYAVATGSTFGGALKALRAKLEEPVEVES